MSENYPNLNDRYFAMLNRENRKRFIDRETKSAKSRMRIIPFASGVIIFAVLILWAWIAFGAEEIHLTASWYSIQSLKKEGTFKYSNGVMANGKEFKDGEFTCATRDYRLGTSLKITNQSTGKSVFVKVTDRINKRFAGKRIDLSKGAFLKISSLRKGIIEVKVEVL